MGEGLGDQPPLIKMLISACNISNPTAWEGQGGAILNILVVIFSENFNSFTRTDGRALLRKWTFNVLLKCLDLLRSNMTITYACMEQSTICYYPKGSEEEESLRAQALGDY